MSIRSPLVSITVPVYNCELFLKGCLESLLRQSLNDWEAIVINDASSDSSGELADLYARRDYRIRCIHHEKNIGLYTTRTRGFSLARGAYITTCDADDQMPEHALYELYNKAVLANADIVHGETVELNELGAGKKLWSYEPFLVTSGTQYVLSFLRNIRGWNTWGKLYKRDLWERSLPYFPKQERLFMAEDLLSSFILGLQAKRYAVVKKAVYCYRLPKTGYFYNSEKALQRIDDHFKVLAILRDTAKEMKELPELLEGVDFLSRHIVASILRSIPHSDELFSKVIEFAQRYSLCHYGVLLNTRKGQNLFSHLRYGGLWELHIAFRRFIAAAKKRGVKTVLEEVGCLLS